MRFEELTYSEAELEKDAIHYFKEQVYEPSYADKVKRFIAKDAADFKLYYDDDEYLFLNMFYDDYQNGYVYVDDDKVCNTDFHRLTKYLDDAMSRLELEDDDVDQYAFLLDAEFRKNAFCSHMEAFFSENDKVAASVIVGYSRNPFFSVYSMVREWCMALHLKKMHPQMFKKFGQRYQEIRLHHKGDERLRLLIDFRDKYRHVFKNVGILRAIHSSVFAYAYLYLKAVQTHEVLTVEDFIMDNSSSKVTLLLQGESIMNFDFPVTKYVLDSFKEGHYKELMNEDGSINWDALYVFTFNAIKETGFDGIYYFGFDSIEAKTMQSYWNKSANMQSMLKILRRLALASNDPVFARLIEGCEYRLGRKDKVKAKMEYFIEQTRKIMAARAYELTKPRTIAQELVAAFPSVFYVYIQWHHNFRNVYPKFPDKAPKVLKQKRLDEDKKKHLLDMVKQFHIYETEQHKKTRTSENENMSKMQAILRNKERLKAELQKKDKSQERIAAKIKENSQRQNFI